MLQHMAPHCVHMGCTKDSAGDWKKKKGYEVGRGKQWVLGRICCFYWLTNEVVLASGLAE